MHQAFVASATLKPMARQLLQDRTPAAYAGVETYASRHAKEDAGSLAWLVLGYAHTLDHDFPKAIDAFSRAKLHAGDLGDYVNFYLGNAYFQAGRTAEAVATLGEFEKNYPESLLIRDAHVLYAHALIGDGRSQEAMDALEKDRQPTRVDVELALGKAYEAAGQNAKAVPIFRNIYYHMPLSGEAAQADAELKKLAMAGAVPPPSLSDRRTRADLLARGRRYGDAANEYHDVVDEVSPADRPEIQLALAVNLRKSGQGREAKKVLESMPNGPAEVNAEAIPPWTNGHSSNQ